MKKILFTALMLCGVLFANAQLQVATLTHNGETTMFYGADALQKANAAADHGDVINLSAGTFNGCIVTKAITLRGAGCSGSQVTFINSDIAPRVSFDSTIVDSTNYAVRIEGLYLDGTLNIGKNFNNATIIKCVLDQIIFDQGGGQAYNMNVYNCKLTNKLSSGAATIYGGSKGSVQTTMGTPTFYNCVISNKTYNLIDNQYIPLTFYNCLLAIGKYLSYYAKNPNKFINCTITSKQNCSESSSNQFFTNCIFINYIASKYNQNPATELTTFEQVFKTFTGTYSDDETFELTDEAKLFLGTDGKEVGIYGGPMPFNTNPTYPRITKLDVGSEVSADGKLSVDIEVKSMNE